MCWKIVFTNLFSKKTKLYRNNSRLLKELDMKIIKIQNNPNIGKNLSGKLSSSKSIRLLKKYRLVFSIDKKAKIVYLEGIGHRKEVYD